MNDCFIEFTGQEFSISDKTFRDNVEVVALKSKMTIVAKTSAKSNEVSYWVVEEFAGERFNYKISQGEYGRLKALLMDKVVPENKSGEVKTNLDRLDVE